RTGAGARDLCGLSPSDPRIANVRCAGLWIFRLPFGPLSAGMFLVRGTAPLESIQQLRDAFSGAMEHNAALSACADLPGIAVELVVEFFFFPPPVLGGAGDVFSRVSLDRQSAGGFNGGVGVRIQRVVVEFADVAEPYRDLQLDAVGRSDGRAGMA